jgi:Na+/phosphate symporter
MSKQDVEDQIRNFIEYYTSNEEEAIKMFNTLDDYINEVYTTWYELNAIVTGAELSELTRAVNAGEFNGHKSMETIYKITNGITKQIIHA